MYKSKDSRIFFPLILIQHGWILFVQEVTVKTLAMLQKIFISITVNAFEAFIHQKVLKKIKMKKKSQFAVTATQHRLRLSLWSFKFYYKIYYNIWNYQKYII